MAKLKFILTMTLWFATGLIPAIAISPTDHFNRASRLIGRGYSDGYHKCGHRCYRPGDDLPLAEPSDCILSRWSDHRGGDSILKDVCRGPGCGEVIGSAGCVADGCDAGGCGVGRCGVGRRIGRKACDAGCDRVACDAVGCDSSGCDAVGCDAVGGYVAVEPAAPEIRVSPSHREPASIEVATIPAAIPERIAATIPATPPLEVSLPTGFKPSLALSSLDQAGRTQIDRRQPSQPHRRQVRRLSSQPTSIAAAERSVQRLPVR